MDGRSRRRHATINGVDDLLHTAAAMAVAYAEGVDERERVSPGVDAIAALEGFDEELPDDGTAAADTLRMLDEVGSPATMASTGARYFGFVIGAVLPVALGGAWLAAAWDQNAALPVMSPRWRRSSTTWPARWLVDVLRLPTEPGVAFVSGATVANASCLAAARDALLAEPDGTCRPTGCSAPRRSRSWSARRPTRRCRSRSGSSASVATAWSSCPPTTRVGCGPASSRISPGPVLVCAQAGEVNSGAFDPFDEIADWLAERGGWLHVDGAFGLWALADPTRPSSSSGLDRADSWATDGHKWLNVTYDCGIAFVREPADLRRTFAAMAGYLPPGDRFEAMHHTPQSSQRARQVEVWSVLRTLGGDGVAELVQRACDVRRGDRRAARGGRADDPQRRRPQPGAGARRRRPAHRRPDRRGPGRRPHLVRSDAVGRRDGDAHQRLELEDRSRRRRARRRRDPRTRRRAGGTPSQTAIGHPGSRYREGEYRIAPPRRDGARSPT